MNNLKEIKVWKKSLDLSVLIYELTNQFPENEKFGITLQMKRSSLSIASNIAEGAGRNSSKEFCRFLNIANGSSYELQTQLIIANKIGYLSLETLEMLESQITEIKKMIYGFLLTLNSKN